MPRDPTHTMPQTVRRFLAVAPGSALLLAPATGWGLEGRAVVMTSHPDELVQRFEQAFECANPGTDMQVVWKPARDATVELRKPDQGGDGVQ